MRLDGYVMFTLVFVAIGVLMIYEFNRAPSAADVVAAAAEGIDAQSLAGMQHAARADTSAIDADPWYHFPWGLPFDNNARSFYR